MLKIHEIREIIKLLDQSSIQKFEFESEGTKLSIKKGRQEVIVHESSAAPEKTTAPTLQPVQAIPRADVVVSAAPVQQVEVKPQTAAAEPKQEENLHKIVSPMVGTFYSKPEPSAPSFVKTGDKVMPNSIVCIVEAMKLFNEIEAEVSGEIVKVLVTEGQLVEYGQPLFLVKPE